MERGRWVMKRAIAVFTCIFCSVRAAEYMYPVVFISPTQVYCIYQKTSHHIELWDWNPVTHLAHQLLLSRFTPAGLRLLPGGHAYSFIDNGVIKIKEHIKRSPKRLELDAPISRFELINWITDSSFYTAAEYRGRYGIFQVSDEGEVYPVLLQESVDCQYPCKVDDKLFYIERVQNQYAIVQVPYRARGLEAREFRERVNDYYACESGSQKTTIANFGLQPIIFLSMASKSEGFVLEHQKIISKRDQAISFTYHRIYAHENRRDGWGVEQLFTFCLPTDLLVPERPGRLYEALLPFLPKHQGKDIYLSDLVQGEFLSLCRWDGHQKVPLLGTISSHIFGPLIMPTGGLLCGGQLGGAEKSEGTFPEMQMTEQGVKLSFYAV